MKERSEAENGRENNAEKKIKRSRGRDALMLLLIAVLVFAGATNLFGIFSGGEDQEGGKADYVVSSETAFFLDTFCSISIYGEGGTKDDEILSEAVELLEEYDDLFNPSKEDSDISRINSRTEKRVRIDETTARLFESIEEPEREAGGDFNLAIDPVSSLWDFRENKEVPEASDIEEALSHVHFGGWSIEEKETGFGREYFFVSEYEDLRVDVGAFAKGFIADELKTFMESEGVGSAIINLGGNVNCIGKKPDGTEFEIGLRKPERGSSEDIAVLSVKDRSVVTAGIYERSFEEAGVIYHHILEPETGYPVQNELAAVSIVGDESVLCDFLSTTLLIKGEEEGLRFLREFNRKRGLMGEEAYLAFFIKKDGSLSLSEGAGSVIKQ